MTKGSKSIPENSIANDKYKVLLEIEEHIQEGLYIIDFQARLIYANRRLAEILGYSNLEDIIGRSVLDFIEAEYSQKMNELFHNYFESADTPEKLVVPVIKAGGGKIWIQLTFGNISSSGLIGTVIDVTHEIRGHTQISDGDTLYKTIVELSPEAIMVCSLDGVILDINDAALKLYECNKKIDAVGTSVIEFVAVDEIERLSKAFQETILSDYSLHTEAKLIGKHGKLFIGEIIAKKIPSKNTFGSIMVFLSRDITDQKTKESDLEKLAIHDPLTKLLNRRGFIPLANQELTHTKRRKLASILIFIDIDKMKSINDTYGHIVGDKVLVLISDTLKSTFRKSDLICRWGGDEFIILALDTDDRHVNVLIDKLHKRIQDSTKEENLEFEVSFSAGYSLFESDTDDNINKLILLADMDMYSNKVRKLP